MKPEKMTLLLMKLRKGVSPSFKMDTLIPILEYLGQWRFQDHVWLEPQSFIESNVSTYSHSMPEAVLQEWEKARSLEVSGLPRHPKLNQNYYQDVGEIYLQSNGNQAFKFRAWKGARGTAVTSPRGQTFNLLVAGDQLLDAYPANLRDVDKQGFWKWSVSQGLIDQINQKLMLDSYEIEREKIRGPVPTRDNVGTCPCCFGLFKLASRKKQGKDKTMPGLVLHGYKRPGTGYLHSNCFGQDWPPFELSHEGTDALIQRLTLTLKQDQQYLDRLQQGDILSLPNPQGPPRKKSDIDSRAWALYLKDEISSQQARVNQIKRDLQDLARHVASWEPSLLPTG